MSTFKILVATDVHLGYKQTHEIRGNDSFNAFQEVLDICQEQQPDILLLGGDLFDTINPSQASIYKCLTMLQNVILGGKQLEFSLYNYQANFLNQNLNVSLPIFTIHGNHDVPMQSGALSVCDLLHASNYVNYFGKYLKLQEVHVVPLIFEKGDTIIALYGIGYIHPFRLSRLFEEKKITFQNPPKGAFCIIMVHQNRYKGKTTGADYQQCLHPEQLPDWTDLIIWCHQHDSTPEFMFLQNKKVYQPGSTIATSLSQGQSIVKHTGLLQINGRQCKLTPHFLQKTYRPIVIISMDLDTIEDIGLDGIQSVIIKTVQKEMYQRIQQGNKNLPLVRVKMQSSQKYRPKIIQLQKHFMNKVANKSQVFKLKKKQIRKKHQIKKQGLDFETRKADRLQHSKDLQQQFGELLQKNLISSAYLVMKPSQIKDIISSQIRNLVQKGSTTKSLQNYIDQTMGRINKNVQKQILQFNDMMKEKYKSTTKCWKDTIQKNLNFKLSDINQEYVQQNKSKQSQLKAIEYESMWQMKINQLNNFNLDQNTSFNFIKQQQLQSKNNQASTHSVNLSYHHHNQHNHSQHDFQEQKCCPQQGIQFNSQTQNLFSQIDEIVKKQKKPKKTKKQSKKQTKKQTKKAPKSKSRSRSKSKKNGFL